MKKRTRAFWVTWALLFASAPSVAQDSWVIRAGTVYTASGDPIEGGYVLVEGQSIGAVAEGTGSGDEVWEVAAVTPGLIDLSVRIGTGSASVEQSEETTAELNVLDTVDLFSHRWDRELASGVTSVLATPYDMNVFGGLGAVLKTGGAPTLEARVVKSEACLRASVGAQPSSGNAPPRGTPPRTFYFRRPTTRMGVEWVFRKLYYDAVQMAGDPSLSPKQAERYAIVQRTLSGELPVSVQASATQDVRTAAYLKEEFNIPKMWIDSACEAWQEVELVRRSGLAVVLPPQPFDGRRADGFIPDDYFCAWGNAAKLHAAGVTVALSGHGALDIGDRLARQAGLAIRGGLPFDAALRAVTINPARLAGVEDRVGSIEVGKDADLVLWSGKPFEPSSRILGVFLSGRLVVDHRSSE